MKVTLNLSKLLQTKKISQDEFDRLVDLAKKDTQLHAFSTLSVLAVIAIGLGIGSLNPSFFFGIAKTLYDTLGNTAVHLIIIFILWAIGIKQRSGFLIGLIPFVILSLLGGSTYYRHASYFVAIEEPALTIFIFSGFALASLIASIKMTPPFDIDRLILMFSRVCLIIVNMGFWIGSLWGSELGESTINPTVFSLGWAAGLLAVGIWGIREGRQFVVNTSVIFGAIHFYTQWFERLGAYPLSLLTAGISALLLIKLMQYYNRRMEPTIKS